MNEMNEMRRRRGRRRSVGGVWVCVRAGPKSFHSVAITWLYMSPSERARGRSSRKRKTEWTAV
jgi:hypothetical protein